MFYLLSINLIWQFDSTDSIIAQIALAVNCQQFVESAIKYWFGLLFFFLYLSWNWFWYCIISGVSSASNYDLQKCPKNKNKIRNRENKMHHIYNNSGKLLSPVLSRKNTRSTTTNLNQSINNFPFLVYSSRKLSIAIKEDNAKLAPWCVLYYQATSTTI